MKQDGHESQPMAWRETVRACLQRHWMLDDWQYRFLTSLQRFRVLSGKQKRYLDRIAEAVLGAGE